MRMASQVARSRRCREISRSPTKSPKPLPVSLIVRGNASTLAEMSASIASTVKNLRLTANTRVIYQGFTGKQATLNAKDSIDYGTRVVGGVSPGKAGKHPSLGLPVFDTVGEVHAEWTAGLLSGQGGT